MRLWLRALSIVVQLGGWTGFIFFVFGIPGHIDDAITWLWWLRILRERPALLVSTVFIITGPLMWSAEWWYPRVRRVFSKSRDIQSSRALQKSSRLNDWLAPDGSLTLEQAAFLWLGTPAQRPIPPDVQDRIAVFQNAIEQGSLRSHLRHDENTEKNLAFFRLLLGNRTPVDTRVMPSELRRWSESIGSVPAFLRCVEPPNHSDADK